MIFVSKRKCPSIMTPLSTISVINDEYREYTFHCTLNLSSIHTQLLEHLRARDQPATDLFQTELLLLSDRISQRQSVDKDTRKFIVSVAHNSDLRVSTIFGKRRMLYHPNAVDDDIRGEGMMLIPRIFGYTTPEAWRENEAQFEELAKNFVRGPAGFNNEQSGTLIHLVKDEVWKRATTPNQFLNSVWRYANGDAFAFRKWFDDHGFVKVKDPKKKRKNKNKRNKRSNRLSRTWSLSQSSESTLFSQVSTLSPVSTPALSSQDHRDNVCCLLNMVNRNVSPNL